MIIVANFSAGIFDGNRSNQDGEDSINSLPNGRWKARNEAKQQGLGQGNTASQNLREYKSDFIFMPSLPNYANLTQLGRLPFFSHIFTVHPRLPRCGSYILSLRI
jgi:hypothetical protein